MDPKKAKNYEKKILGLKSQISQTKKLRKEAILDLTDGKNFPLTPF